MIGPVALLRTIAATHRLSTVDRRLPRLGTRRRVLTVDNTVDTPQSLLLSAGCRTFCRAEAETWLPGHQAYRQHTFTQKYWSQMKIKSKISQSGAACGPQKIEKIGKNHLGKRSRACGGLRGLHFQDLVQVS